MKNTYKTGNTQVIFIFFTWTQSIVLPFYWCSGAGRLSCVVLMLWRNQQRNALLEWLQNQQNAATSLFIPSGWKHHGAGGKNQQGWRWTCWIRLLAGGRSAPCASAVRKVTSLKSRAVYVPRAISARACAGIRGAGDRAVWLLMSLGTA